MALQINQIVNGNVYVDGNNMLGRVSEIDAPEVMAKFNEFKAMGLIGTFELPAGFSAMELRLKWNSFYRDIAAQFINPFKKTRLTIRASQEVWEGGDRVSEKPVVIYATCQSKGFPAGKYKQNEAVEVENKLACTHVKMEIDGVEVFEIDIMNNIFKVNGEDQMAAYRANIGG